MVINFVAILRHLVFHRQTIIALSLMSCVVFVVNQVKSSLIYLDAKVANGS